MKDIPFHIIAFGEESSEFISETKESDICRVYQVAGHFGNAAYELLKFSFGTLRLFTLTLDETAQIRFTAAPAALFVLHCRQGHFNVYQNGSLIVRQGQTLVSVILNESVSAIDLKFSIKKKKTFSFMLLSLSSETMYNKGKGSQDLAALHRYIGFLESKKIISFVATLHFQVIFLRMIETSGGGNSSISYMESCIGILLQEIAEQPTLREDLLVDVLWDTDRQAVYRVAERILLGLDESWTIQKLAKDQQLNVNKFKSLFKKYIGMPAAAFKILVRMQKARQLLKETSLTIQEISAQVGYTNPAQFSAMFKRKLGYTPNELRKATAQH